MYLTHSFVGHTPSCWTSHSETKFTQTSNETHSPCRNATDTGLNLCALYTHISLHPPSLRSYFTPFSLVGSSWHRSRVVNPPGLPDCALLKNARPLRTTPLPISAGQFLKAARCDGTDWQLGSDARGYQRSVSHEQAPSHGLA